jgi:hypothetical protein
MTVNSLFLRRLFVFFLSREDLPGRFFPPGLFFRTPFELNKNGIAFASLKYGYDIKSQDGKDLK